VIRISGPQSGPALKALIGRVPEPRRAAFAVVREPTTGEMIDESLALWFPGPQSETGEDVAELQTHGGRAVIAAVLAALGAMDGLRLAEPGEFTRRAFESGRMDLTQVEALADLIGAETQAQRRQAFAQVRGLLGERAERWRQSVIDARAQVEAGIDFSDEGDVPGNLVTQAVTIVRAVKAEIADAIASAGRGERLRDGLTVVIAGAPNAGKSTLLNRIARRDAAIVSPFAGTTRDVIEVHLDLDGYPVTLIDTAGLRERSDDPIEQEGMRRARETAARADLVLWVADASAPEPMDEGNGSSHPPAGGARRITVLNKIDRLDAAAVRTVEARAREPDHMAVSAATGRGIDRLVSEIVRAAAASLALEPALVSRERQRITLTEVAAALAAADKSAAAGDGEEIVAEHLRHAATGLGRLTGRIDVEEVLDVIFRDFCIGK
jgi:tRNA modification GTPase